jgi:hypothetical protein
MGQNISQEPPHLCPKKKTKPTLLEAFYFRWLLESKIATGTSFALKLPNGPRGIAATSRLALWLWLLFDEFKVIGGNCMPRGTHLLNICGIC